MKRRKYILERVLWNVLWLITIRPFPRHFASKWEIILLRWFGSQIGPNCKIYSSAKIWLPRNLIMEEGVCIADHVYIQNSKPVIFKKYSVVGQYSYICDGSHALDDVKVGLSKSIVIGERVWIGADSYIAIGVHLGRGCVVGARTVVRSSTPPYSVLIGNPAKIVNFSRDPNSIIEYEKQTYPENERLSEEVLNRNYERFFKRRIKDINQFISI